MALRFPIALYFLRQCSRLKIQKDWQAASRTRHTFFSLSYVFLCTGCTVLVLICNLPPYLSLHMFLCSLKLVILFFHRLLVPVLPFGAGIFSSPPCLVLLFLLIVLYSDLTLSDLTLQPINGEKNRIFVFRSEFHSINTPTKSIVIPHISTLLLVKKHTWVKKYKLHFFEVEAMLLLIINRCLMWLR